MARYSRDLRTVEKYGVQWSPVATELEVEMECIRKGGRWNFKGKECGAGLFHHMKRMQQIIHPEKSWHKWNDLLVSQFCDKRFIGIMGPASSGKTREAADFVRMMYYCFPRNLTVLVSSTEREMLEMRVWGEIKKYHREAQERFPELPGYIIESKQRIVTDSKMEYAEGRDFRDGMCGIPVKRGGSYQGLGCFLAGTMVDTPFGQIPIENVKVGDVVMSAIGPRKVIETHIRNASELVKMVLSNGAEIICTPEHPFFTNKGWVNSIDVGPEHVLLSAHETMQIMREGEACKPASVLQRMQNETSREGMPCLQEEIHSFGQQEHMLFKALHDEVENVGQGNGCENHVQQRLDCNGGEAERALQKAPRSKGEKSGVVPTEKREVERLLEEKLEDKKSSWATPIRWLRKWFSSNIGRNRIYDPFSRSRISTSNFVSNGSEIIEKQNWISTLLSSRFWFQRSKTCNRNRRGCTRKKNTDSERQEKRIPSKEIRLVSSSIVEPSSFEQYERCNSTCNVHNLSVEGHPSYSVEGVIVHNSMAGVKNKMMILVADELAFMPKAFIDAISNMNKNPGFKCIGIGNPKDETDALGLLCEPATEHGGWQGGIDQSGGTKTWNIRFPEGVCVQLVGPDSPNFDSPAEEPPPYPFLITREAIAADKAFYGEDSHQYRMMDEGRMPRGAGNRRVITRTLCEKHHATEPVIWKDANQFRIGFMDAAYSAVGGDRCVFGELRFGNAQDENGDWKQMMALVDLVVVPVSGKVDESPEDQIAHWTMNACDERGILPQNFFYDGTGRSSLTSAFARLWSPHVVPIEFGGKPSERMVSRQIRTECHKYYSKFVTELWWSVRLIIEAGQFRGLTPDVMAEGSMREWGFVSGNRIEVETKDKMKVRVGRSPDLFDALVAGVEGARRRGFIIENLATKANPQGSLWIRNLVDKTKKFRKSYELSYSH